jgi:S-layer domain
MTVEVTNNRDQRLTDIEASLGTSDPLDSDDDSGYIAALDPGESETVTFELSATGDANPKTYAAAVDFRYDDARGISRMSETYQLPVDVETDDGMELASISPLTIVIVLAVAAAAYGAAVYARAKPERLPWR